MNSIYSIFLLYHNKLTFIKTNIFIKYFGKELSLLIKILYPSKSSKSAKLQMTYFL